MVPKMCVLFQCIINFLPPNWIISYFFTIVFFWKCFMSYFTVVFYVQFCLGVFYSRCFLSRYFFSMCFIVDTPANLDQACLMSVLFLQLKIDHIFSILKKYFIFFSDGDVDVCHSIKSSSWSSNNFNQPRVVNLCPHLYSPFDLHTGKIIIIIYFQKNDDVNKSCLQQHYF